jgi:hypothetical protein
MTAPAMAPVLAVFSVVEHAASVSAAVSTTAMDRTLRMNTLREVC